MPIFGFLLFIFIPIFFLPFSAVANSPVRYVALGDSYTEGTGLPAGQGWPDQLVDFLQAQGVPVELAANLGRNGFSCEDVIQAQLPKLDGLNPDFVTLQVGVNDWVRGKSEQEFAECYSVLAASLEKILSKERIVLITIPDFSVTPQGGRFGHRGAIAAGLAKFNAIISEVARRRGLQVVDVFELSREMGTDPQLVAPDGLHPSAEEYRKWVERIGPVVDEMLKPLSGKEAQ